MTDDIVLNDTQSELVDLLFYYRCATPIQLAKFAYGPLAVTVSNEKYIYGQLAKLEDEGLVTRYKPHKRVSKYAVFYLSKKGFDIKLTQLSLPDGYIGSGWTGWHEQKNETIDYGHFDYAVYKPPLKQLQHHLLMIDTLLVLYPLQITYRNNLYARRTITNGKFRTILRADAEFKINGKIFTIEIDRGTESHEQLVAKFDNYFNYIAENRNTHGQCDIKHIVFVVDAPHDGHLKRRWTNILAAYYKGLKKLADEVELHLVTLDKLDTFLSTYNNVIGCGRLFSDALLRDYNLALTGELEVVSGHYKSKSVQPNIPEPVYILYYQFISTPYSTFNLKLRLSANQFKNVMHYYMIDEPYFPDKLDAYLTDQEKAYEQEIVLQYAQVQNKGELFELQK